MIVCCGGGVGDEIGEVRGQRVKHMHGVREPYSVG